jgi:hypothetical protein
LKGLGTRELKRRRKGERRTMGGEKKSAKYRSVAEKEGMKKNDVLVRERETRHDLAGVDELGLEYDSVS